MAADDRLLDPLLVHLHACAIVAVARADDEISLEEGLRLRERLEARAGHRVALDDLLLAPALTPADLAAQLGAAAAPFRSAGIHPAVLAAMIVTDAVAVAMAKGHLAEVEAHALIAFGTALGCSREDLLRFSARLAPWLP